MTKRDRLHQIHRWLQDRFVAPFPTRLVIKQLNPPGKAIDQLGGCDRYFKPDEFVLVVEKRLNWRLSIEVLLHEYAHAISWPMGAREDYEPEHLDEWGLAYAKIYRAFYDEGGDVEAKEY